MIDTVAVKSRRAIEPANKARAVDRRPTAILERHTGHPQSTQNRRQQPAACVHPFSPIVILRDFAKQPRCLSVSTPRPAFSATSVPSATSRPTRSCSASKASTPRRTLSSTSASVLPTSTRPSVPSTAPRSASCGAASPALTATRVWSRFSSRTRFPPSRSVPAPALCCTPPACKSRFVFLRAERAMQLQCYHDKCMNASCFCHASFFTFQHLTHCSKLACFSCLFGRWKLTLGQSNGIGVMAPNSLSWPCRRRCGLVCLSAKRL